MVKGVRVESAKIRESSSTLEWIMGPAVFDAENVAMSLGPLGTVCGVQLAAVFQSLLEGLTFQVAPPPKAESKKEELRIKKAMSVFLCMIVFTFVFA